MTRQSILFALILMCVPAARGQVDVLTANYDNNRTNATLNETLLNTNNVNPTQFGKLFTYPVDGQVYAQPLYVHALNLPGVGTRNVLIIATMHNSVYAFDADATAATAPFWHMNFGATVDPLSIINPAIGPYTDIQHEIGIVSTPAIDRTGNTIYVVNETVQSGAAAFYLHALDLTTGSEKFNGPVEIQASVIGTGWGDSTNGQLSFLSSDHIQRPGLLLTNATVYIGFGSHGDFVPWHGWIMAYNAATLQQISVFCTTPDGAGSAIWQSGRGLAADQDGQVYASTGNGTYDGRLAWGESVLHLTPSLTVADWFTPAEFALWTDDDTDFGSNGPILVPNTNLLVAGGKAGLVALVDRTNMGHELANDTGAVQVFQAVPNAQSFAIFNAALWDQPDGPIFYIWAQQDPLRSFRLQNGAFNTVDLATNSTAQNALPLGGFSVSSNGSVPGTGIVWATSADTGGFPTTGALHAFEAVDVSHELWNSKQNAARDALGNFTKFANPTVVNGRVFVPTDSQQVDVYGLLPVPGIAAVVNAASLGSATIAPGELIAIFGLQLGPTVPAGLALDPDGKVTTNLAGVTVSFDGVLAPLLYVSQNQINAVVPFEVSGKSTTVMQITAPGGATYSATLPVSAAVPALFSLSASGSGQGAILNSDMTVNSPARPAAVGSSIAIYATGGGTLSDQVADGSVIPAPLPLSAAVSVTIGGVAARVTYKGAAPGFVAGVMQINAQIPSGITVGPAVPVGLAVGFSAALNSVTVAVQ